MNVDKSVFGIELLGMNFREGLIHELDERTNVSIGGWYNIIDYIPVVFSLLLDSR